MCWDISSYLAGDTSFSPPLQRHIDLLSEAPSAELRATIADQLQRTYGNRYVQRVIKSLEVQAELIVSKPNDPQEREAEWAAEQIMKRVALQRQAGAEDGDREVGRKPYWLQLEADEVQRQPADSHPPEMTENLEAHIQKARGYGHPLPNTLREPMEQALGTDFSRVRLHTDAEADALDQALNARAFTAGEDIFFRQGEYNPSSDSGQRLIAHELSHVIQQGASGRNCQMGRSGQRDNQP